MAIVVTTHATAAKQPMRRAPYVYLISIMAGMLADEQSCVGKDQNASWQRCLLIFNMASVSWTHASFCHMGLRPVHHSSY